MHCNGLHHSAAVACSGWLGGEWEASKRWQTSENARQPMRRRATIPSSLTSALAICCDSPERHGSITMISCIAFCVQICEGIAGDDAMISLHVFSLHMSGSGWHSKSTPGQESKGSENMNVCCCPCLSSAPPLCGWPFHSFAACEEGPGDASPSSPCLFPAAQLHARHACHARYRAGSMDASQQAMPL